MEITLGASVRLYGPDDGDVEIPKGVVHSLKTHKGVACIFQERTDPMVSEYPFHYRYRLIKFYEDGEKEVFFRNLLAQGSIQPSNLFDLAQICYKGDMRLAFPGHFAWFEKAVSFSFTRSTAPHQTHVSKFVVLLGGYIAPILGYRLKHEFPNKRD